MQSPEVTNVMQNHEANGSQHSCPTLARCKALDKTMKMQEQVTILPNASLGDMIPAKTVADRLAQAYFRTFQTVFGILHILSFREHYKTFWEDSESASKDFETTLLIVMSINSTFSSPETGISRATVLQWIEVACIWLSSIIRITKPSHHESRNSPNTVSYCACPSSQIVSGDNAWLSTGFMLRMVLHKGLHIDPEAHSSPNMGP